MIRIAFRPLPGLSIATLLGVLLLIGLGTWQYQRLQWKTELLSAVETAATAPAFTSISDVYEALAAGEPVDFRRIGTTVRMKSEPPHFHVFTARQRTVAWRPFAAVSDGGPSVFAAFAAFNDTQKDNPPQLGTKAGSAFPIAGYVRIARPMGRFETQSTPDKNRWFGFNPMPKRHAWPDYISVPVNVEFYIDTVPEAREAQSLVVRRPDIRNNHFDYMLTWYGLALALCVMYLIFHIQAGRLSWRRPS